MASGDGCYAVVWPWGFPHFVEKGTGTAARLSVVFGHKKGDKKEQEINANMLSALSRRNANPKEAKAEFVKLAKPRSAKSGPHQKSESEWDLLKYFGDMYVGGEGGGGGAPSGTAGVGGTFSGGTGPSPL